MKTEKNGSNVDLAVHFLRDPWSDACECAVVATKDSDISEAFLVRQRLASRELAYGQWPSHSKRNPTRRIPPAGPTSLARSAKAAVGILAAVPALCDRES